MANYYGSYSSSPSSLGEKAKGSSYYDDESLDGYDDPFAPAAPPRGAPLLPEAEVKGRLATLLGTAVSKIKTLEEQLAKERVKAGMSPMMSSSHSLGIDGPESPGREIYVSPRHHIETSLPGNLVHGARSGTPAASPPARKGSLIGPFSPSGERLLLSSAASLVGGGGDRVGGRLHKTNVTQTFSLAEQKNLRQASSRSKQTSDRLRESLASLQHEKSKLELQYNHLKSKLSAANEKSVSCERRLLEARLSLEQQEQFALEKEAVLAKEKQRVHAEMVKSTQLEETLRRLKHENSTGEFVAHQRKDQVSKLKKKLKVERKTRGDLEEKLKGMKEKSASLQHDIDRMNEQNEREKHQMEELKETLAQKSDEIGAAQENRNGLLEKIKLLKNELKAHEALVGDAENTIASQKEKHAHDISIQTSKKQELTDALARLREEKERVDAEYSAMEAANNAAKEDIRSKKEVLGSLESKLQAQKSENASLTDSINGLKEELRRANEARLRSDSRRRVGEDEITKAEERLDQLQQDLDKERMRGEAVHRENIKTQEELSAVRDRIYREEESLKRAEAQLRNRTEALEKERQETGKLRKQRLEMEVTRQQKKREVEDLEKALGSLQSRLNNAQLDKEREQEKVERVQNELSQARDEGLVLERQAEEGKRANERLEQEVSRLRGTIERLKATIDSVENEKDRLLSNAEERYKSLEKTMDNLRSKINSDGPDTSPIASRRPSSAQRRFSALGGGVRRSSRRQSLLATSASAAAMAAASNSMRDNEAQNAKYRRETVNVDSKGHFQRSRSFTQSVDEDVRLRALRGRTKQHLNQSPMMVKFEKDSIFRTLSKSASFKDIPHDALQALIDASVIYSFSSGQYIIKQGEMGARMYIIASGKVVITRSQLKVINGETKEVEQNLINRGLGQFFGEFAMVADTVRTANVISSSSTVKVLGIGRDTYESLNARYDNVLEKAFAPHRVGVNQDTIRIPTRSRGMSRIQRSTLAPAPRNKGMAAVDEEKKNEVRL
jgi:predicted  nucleic acid-binding Zn-ribbon protein